MIPVQAQPEPELFDGRVRQPGNAGRPTDALPDHWTRCLPDLYRVYGGICAYLAVSIPPGAGSRTVDHYLPKSLRPDLAYEWSNYRLACSLMNSRKRDYLDVLDPFSLAPDTFVLDFADLSVAPAPGLPVTTQTAAVATIARLRLNDPESRAARGHALDLVLRREASLAFLAEVSPFVAREWSRQGRSL